MLKARARMGFWVRRVVFDKNVEIIDGFDLVVILYLPTYCFSIRSGLNRYSR